MKPGPPDAGTARSFEGRIDPTSFRLKPRVEWEIAFLVQAGRSFMTSSNRRTGPSLLKRPTALAQSSFFSILKVLSEFRKM